AEQRNKAAAATSDGFANRPSGIVARNFARISGESVPRKLGKSGVSPATGARPFTRMWSGASSTAMDLVSKFTAPFDPLYQVSPGRGRKPAVESILRKTLLPWARMA